MQQYANEPILYIGDTFDLLISRYADDNFKAKPLTLFNIIENKQNFLIKGVYCLSKI